MDAIARQIANPEWWFTVVVVGLLIGVVAAYAKEGISALLSSVSKRFRAFAERRKARRNTEVVMLIADRQLLLIEYVRCLFLLAAVAILLWGSFFLVAWDVMRTQFPDIDPLTQMFSFNLTLFGFSVSSTTRNLIVQLVFGIPGLAMWNVFLDRFFICESARRKIRGGKT